MEMASSARSAASGASASGSSGSSSKTVSVTNNFNTPVTSPSSIAKAGIKVAQKLLGF
jgi:hypothetical protein